MEWDLVPGIAKVLEERLGKPGYYMGTVAVLMVAIAMMLSPFVALGLIVGSVSLVVDDFSVGFGDAGDYIFPLAFATGLAIMFYIGTRIIAMRMWRRLRKEEAAILEHLALHEDVGDHVVIVVSGEEAQKQWPAIRRRLPLWASGQADED